MVGISLAGWDRMGWHGGPAEWWMRIRDRRATLAALVLGWNLASNAPRMREGIEADRELRALAASLEERGLRTGYSDFLIAGPLSMVTNERVTVVGLLGPTNGEHLDRQISLVASQGPDFLLTRPEEEAGLARRLNRLGVTFETYGATVRIFYKLSRRVSIDELTGFRDDS